MMQTVGVLRLIREVSERGEGVLVATIVGEGGDVLKFGMTETGELIGSFSDWKVIEGVRGSLRELLRGEDRVKCYSVRGSDGRLYRVVLEALRPKVKMLVFGAGHVGQAVSLIGALLGYSVRVFDDRDEFLLRERFPDPGISLVTCDFDRLGDMLGDLRGSVIVIVTRGHQYDEQCLKAVVGSAAGYIGMIGSRRRVLSIFKKLRGSGVEEKNLEKVHAPIGLRIGAVTPQEIAVSILSEIIRELSLPKLEGQS